jgi:exopolysaccharide biosynthesis WecB/TagA/CpsF family protein
LAKYGVAEASAKEDPRRRVAAGELRVHIKDLGVCAPESVTSPENALEDVPALPPKHELLGVHVSDVDYARLLDIVFSAAKTHRGTCITHLAVHGLVEGSCDPEFRALLNTFDVVAPDGQPVRHALNWVRKTKLADRCCGPEMTLRVCERAANEGIGVYLYGSAKEVVEAMRDNLVARYPGLKIVGAEPSAFRPLTDEEDAALVDRVNASGAGIVFVGLGCPLQERFAFAHRDKFNAVQITIGFAFDVHAGNKKQAPEWMGRHSLEWLYRLLHEPRRLAKRYFITNSIFLLKLIPYLLGLR